MVLSHDSSRRQAYLRRHNFSCLLSPQAVEALQLYRFSDGDYLCREDSPARFLHFMVDGRCRVARCLSNGKESLICFYHDFALSGEVELIGGYSQSINSVQATGPCWCLSLPMDQARALLLSDPRSLRFLCSHLCRKLMQSNLNMSISLNYPVEQRLASYIYCSCQNRENLFRANFTHLSEYLGCSHRQLLRVLRRFREAGLLKKEAQGYLILNVKGLEQLAGDIYSP